MKRTFFSLLSIPLLLLSLGAFTACADWTDDDGSSALAKTNDDAPLLIKQAQCLIGDGAVSTVDIHSGDHVPAANHRKTRAARTCETFEVDWSDYRMIRQFGQEVAIIPLTRKSQTAYIELTEKGRTKKSVNKVSSRLIVRYDSLNHRPVAVVGTYVYDKNYASRHKNVTDTIGFDFRNTDYTGYFVSSRLDGTMLAGTRYVKGHEQFRFGANPIPPEERDSTDVDEDLHLYLDLHSVRM